MGFDNWLTDPEKVLPRVRDCLGTINYDPASNVVAQQYVGAEQFCISYGDYKRVGLLPENCTVDGLEQRWNGQVWSNFPYSRGLIDAFVDKWVEERARCGMSRSMLTLVNAATDSRWYHKLLQHSDCHLAWSGRIHFWKIDIDAGVAHKKWEGEKSKREGKGKIDNSPKFLNTIFYSGPDIARFCGAFAGCGTFLQVYSPPRRAVIRLRQRLAPTG